MISKHCGDPMRREETEAGSRVIVDYYCRHCPHHEQELRSHTGMLLGWQNMTAKKSAA